MANDLADRNLDRREAWLAAAENHRRRPPAAACLGPLPPAVGRYDGGSARPADDGGRRRLPGVEPHPVVVRGGTRRCVLGRAADCLRALRRHARGPVRPQVGGDRCIHRALALLLDPGVPSSPRPEPGMAALRRGRRAVWMLRRQQPSPADDRAAALAATAPPCGQRLDDAELQSRVHGRPSGGRRLDRRGQRFHAPVCGRCRDLPGGALRAVAASSDAAGAAGPAIRPPIDGRRISVPARADERPDDVSRRPVRHGPRAAESVVPRDSPTRSTEAGRGLLACFRRPRRSGPSRPGSPVGGSAGSVGRGWRSWCASSATARVSPRSASPARCGSECSFSRCPVRSTWSAPHSGRRSCRSLRRTRCGGGCRVCSSSSSPAGLDSAT